MQFNQFLLSGHAARMLLMTVLGFSVFTLFAIALYVFGEFIVNKGPDDWGSLWHSGYPLSAKYGKWHESSYELQSFEKDANGSGSGTYHVHFEYNQHTGVVLCHYDKLTGKFDSDQVVPDN